MTQGGGAVTRGAASGGLVVRGLSYRRREREIFRGVDFHLECGERLALLGNNGAGKSTLLRILAGTLEGAHGGIHFSGVPLECIPAQARWRIFSWLPQAVWRDDHFTVRGFLALHAAGDEGGADLSGERGQAVLRLFHVSHLLDRTLEELSGGEWRRVQLAKTWLPGAGVLLLDEPTAGLDLAHVSALRRALVGDLVTSDFQGEKVRDAKGVTAVFSTHDLGFAAAAATHVLALDEGRAVFFGTLDAFCESRVAERLSGVDVRWQSLVGEDGRRWSPRILY